MIDSLNKRYSVKLLASILSGIINAVIVALVPSAMGPVAYGQFTYLQQFFNQVTAFLDAGTSTAFFTKLSADNSRLSLVVFYLYYSFFVFLALLAFSGAVYYFELVEFFVDGIGYYSFFLGMLLGYVVWLSQIAIKISDAFALTVPVEITKIIHKITVLVLLVFLISFFKLTLNYYLIFTSFASVVLILFLVVYFFKRRVMRGSDLKKRFSIGGMVKEFWIYVLPLFSFNVLSIGIAFLDLWLLQYVSGTDAVGFYGLAYSIAAMCFVFTSAMTPVITREYSKLYADGDFDNIRLLFEKYLPLLYLIAAYFGVFIAIHSEFILHLFADERFDPAIFTLSLMALYPLHQTFGQITSSLFFASGDTVKYRNIGIIASLFGLLLTLFFVVYLEMADQGFAIKMLIVQLFGVNVQLYYNSKMLKFNFVKFLMLQFSSVLVVFVVACFVVFIMPDFDSSLIEFICSGFVYTFLLLLVFIKFPVLFGVNDKNAHLVYAFIAKKIYMRKSADE